MAAAKHPGKVFVNAEDVKNSLDDYRIFDCRYKLTVKEHGRAAYAAAHVKDATRADVDEDLSEISPKSTARHPLPPPEKFVAWCKANGITAGKPVLCYDDECGAFGACRLWWMLDTLGVEAYVVNGGVQACEAAGLPMESGQPANPPSPAASWPFGTAYKHQYTIHELPPNAILTDARSAQRFNSTVRPAGADPVPGHIEGALNLPFDKNLTQRDGYPVLENEETIRHNILAVLGDRLPDGSTDVSDCVFSCGSGLTATINIALARHVGLGLPYLYCGSWSEYCGLFKYPMLRSIVNDYGLYIQLQSPPLLENPVAQTGTHTILVDGTASHELDSEVKSALAHLHLSEKATVYFKSGRVVTIEVAR